MLSDLKTDKNNKHLRRRFSTKSHLSNPFIFCIYAPAQRDFARKCLYIYENGGNHVRKLARSIVKTIVVFLLHGCCRVFTAVSSSLGNYDEMMAVPHDRSHAAKKVRRMNGFPFSWDSSSFDIRRFVQTR